MLEVVCSGFQLSGISLAGGDKHFLSACLSDSVARMSVGWDGSLAIEDGVDCKLEA